MSLLPHSRRGAVWRFLVASVLVVLFAATATAVAGLLQFKQFAHELAVTPAIQNARITVADAGAPQTLLLIGSDHRAGTSWKTANTDTMMLVRLDAASSTINVLSIPRDLEVRLPQGNVVAPGRVNMAYSLGGPNLLVRTLSDQVFRGIHVNHIIDVNFGGFSALVDALGCVYADVDRRYFNISAPGADNYASIDIQPGYQKLCGDDALQFVRFRHLDNDFVRVSRQQAFLRWAKSGFSTGSLVAQRDHLIAVFGAHTQTDADLHSIDGLINLFNLVAFSAGHTVRQVSFPGRSGPCDPVNHPTVPCYVVSDPGAEARAFADFMRPTAQRPAAAKPNAGARRGAPAPSAPPPAAPLTDVTVSDGGQAHALAAYGLGMPVFLPASIAAGSNYCADGTCPQGPVHNSYPRAYTITDPAGHRHAAYRATLVVDPVLGQYYGIEGTTWQDPPILSGTHDTRMVAGKLLQIYRQGQKIVLVAWHTPAGVFWVSNTLTSDLTNAQMVAIAASLRRF